MSDPRELIEADREAHVLAELFLASLDGHPSPAGHDRVREAIATCRETAAAFRSDDPFESRLARHLVATTDLLDAVVRRRFDPRRHPVDGVLDALTGRAGSRERLEAFLAELDPDRFWSYLTERSRARGERVPADHPDVRDTVARRLERTVESFREWLRGRAPDAPGLDAEIAIGPSQGGRSFYQPGAHRIVLDVDEIVVRRRPRGLDIDPRAALRSIAHELGHAAQDVASRELPAPLRPDDHPRVRYATLPAAEGFAAHLESFARDFVAERREELGLEGRDVEAMAALVEFAPVHSAGPALAMALAQRADDDPSFDAEAHLEAAIGHPGLTETYRRMRGEPLNRMIYHAACFFGREAVADAAARLEGDGFSRGETLAILARGAWAPAVLPDAVEAEAARRRATTASAPPNPAGRAGRAE